MWANKEMPDQPLDDPAIQAQVPDTIEKLSMTPDLSNHVTEIPTKNCPEKSSQLTEPGENKWLFLVHCFGMVCFSTSDN